MKDEFIKVGYKVIRKCIIDVIWYECRPDNEFVIFVKDKSGFTWPFCVLQTEEEAKNEINKAYENL